MEVEVRAVGWIEDCFVSLPLSLIQTLQSTAGGILPPLLALDLRSRDGGCWKLAWSGSASRSPAIEISRKFAVCISLVDQTNVQVKVVASLPKAVFVTIEPNSEDDWEILELNSELAEGAILKQVGVVHEGMRFPLWLHGHTVVLFHVVSVSPEKSVVQLVPGTEVAVAPKMRKNSMDSHQHIKKPSSSKGQRRTIALLRVQAPTKRVVHKFKFKDSELGVVLTSVAFIHPETARNSSFENLHLVNVFPRLSLNENLQNDRNSTFRRESFPATEGTLGISLKEAAYKTVTVRLLFSDTVAKGHLMLPQSLHLFLRVNVHSWVYVKGHGCLQKNDVPLMTLSPCRFKLSGMNNSTENNSSYILENRKNFRNKNLPPSTISLISAEPMDWSLHEELLTSLSCEFDKHDGEKTASKLCTTREIKYLICSWLVGQLKAIASHMGGTSISSVVLGNETLFHFEVISNNFGNRRHQSLPGIPSDKKTSARESNVELLYLLTAVFEESSVGGLQNTLELSLDADYSETMSPRDLQLPLGKLELGEPVSLNSPVEHSSTRSFSSTVSSLSWMEAPISHTVDRLSVLLSPSSQKLLDTFCLPLPGHVLVYGPPGSGKTSLAMAIADYFEQHEEILAHIVFISGSKLALEKNLTIRQTLKVYISEALVHSPSLIIFDDLDNVVSTTSELEGSQLSSATIPLVEFLTDIMDEYGEIRQNSCGLGPIAFMACAQSITKLPQSLCSSGRFDFHIQLPAPATSERGAILKHEVHKRSLECSEGILSEIASKCDGYDAYDLEILVDRSVHAASSRFLLSHDMAQEHQKPTLVREDFLQAMHGFVPVAMRGLTKAASEGGHSGWEDVGGLNDIQKAIQEMVELPSKFSNIFAQAPLRLRSNVLLYGPPGCGKTHIVGAAAAACSLRFISIKGPELLNKYIGASEQAVRDLFGKAAAAAPCLLFFDEFDSIAPKRGHDNTGVTDRVVNQLLTELDGVESLTGVFVFAATSRPDLLDAALLRPGRLDRLLFCDFPSWHERLDILKVLSRKLPLASDVCLETIASMTEGFSGADLQALLSDSQLASVHEFLDSGDDDKSGKAPVISDELLKSVASRTRPSVSEAEKQRLHKIYSQFLGSKKSVNAQSRDAKGKRATLA